MARPTTLETLLKRSVSLIGYHLWNTCSTFDDYKELIIFFFLILDVASGGSIDWVKGVLRTPLVYAYELRDLGRFGFVLPPEQIIPTAEETLDSIIVILEEGANYGYH